MKPLFLIMLVLLVPVSGAAQSVAPGSPPVDPPKAIAPLAPLAAKGVNPDDFLWVARPLVVFADTPADPRFQRQMELLAQRPGVLAGLDVVVITDTTPAPLSALREKLRPRGFMWALIDKDGSIMLRKPLPWNIRELSRAINKTPLRQQELKEKRDLGG